MGLVARETIDRAVILIKPHNGMRIHYRALAVRQQRTALCFRDQLLGVVARFA